MIRKRKNRERITQKAMRHSSLGEFTRGDNKHLSRLKSGGHGEENIQELKKRGIKYDITKQYPNGVRVGNVSNHINKRKREQNGQTWFPKDWNRKTIKKAGEKTVNSIPYKLPDGMNMFGTYKKVKVVVKRQKGKVATIFPHYKQSGGKK